MAKNQQATELQMSAAAGSFSILMLPPSGVYCHYKL